MISRYCSILLRFLGTHILYVDFGLRGLGNAEPAARLALVREPILLEPLHGLVPPLAKVYDGLKSQIPFGRFDVEPSMHREDDDVESVEFHGHADQIPWWRKKTHVTRMS